MIAAGSDYSRSGSGLKNSPTPQLDRAIDKRHPVISNIFNLTPMREAAPYGP